MTVYARCPDCRHVRHLDGLCGECDTVGGNRWCRRGLVDPPLADPLHVAEDELLPLVVDRTSSLGFLLLGAAWGFIVGLVVGVAIGVWR